MNFRTTLVLMGLLIVLAGAFVFLVIPQDQPSISTNLGARQAGGALLTADRLSFNEIESITIEQGGEFVEISKIGAAWMQTQPVRFVLGEFTTGETLIRAAVSARYSVKRRPGEKDFPALNQIDLDPPLAVLTFHRRRDDADQNKIRSFTLCIGRRVGRQCYVMLNNQPDVYVIDAALHRLAVEENVRNWRARRITFPGEQQAQRMTLATAAGRVEMEKIDLDWRFVGADQGRVNREAIERLLESAASLPISEFFADNPEDLSMFGLDQPMIELKAHGPAAHQVNQQQIYVLQIGAPADLTGDSRFAAVFTQGESSLIVFKTPVIETTKLATTLDSLRDARISTTNPVDLTGLHIRRANGSVLAIKRGLNGWSFSGESAPTFALDQQSANDLAVSVLTARATSFAPNAKPSDPPDATVEVHAIGRPTPETLRIYRRHPDDSHCLAIRNDETVSHHVPVELLNGLFDPASALRERTIWDAPLASISQLQVQQVDGRTFSFQRTTAGESASGVWTLESGQAFEAPALKELLVQTHLLRAEQWVDSATPHSNTTAHVRIETKTGESYAVALDPVSQIGWVDHIPDSTFLAPQELIDAIGAEFRHRTILSFGLDEIESITRESTIDSPHVTLRNQGGGYLADSGEPVDQTHASILFDTLAGLRAQRYVEALAQSDVEPTCSLTIQLRDGRSARMRLISAPDPTNDSVLAIVESPQAQACLLNAKDARALLAVLIAQ